MISIGNLCLFGFIFSPFVEFIPYVRFLMLIFKVQKAIEYLKVIGALDANENLTALGVWSVSRVSVVFSACRNLCRNSEFF